jgi:hypothetical protein
MSRRKPLLLSARMLVALVGVGLLTIMMLWGSHDHATWPRSIRIGMTSAEVQRVLRGHHPERAAECWFTDEIQSCSRGGWVLLLTYQKG